MSRSDYPPGYDDCHGPMYAPQGGNYPPPPAYGFPSYGGLQPGQPSAPYPTGPNSPLYPGQPGGYPPGPYPGQPHPAGPPGAGYPNPPPMPPVMPPTIPSDILTSGKTGTPEHINACLLMGLTFFKTNIKYVKTVLWDGVFSYLVLTFIKKQTSYIQPAELALAMLRLKVKKSNIWGKYAFLELDEKMDTTHICTVNMKRPVHESSNSHLWLFIGEGWHVTCGSYLCSADHTGDEFAASGSGWDSMSIRHAFIRKVKHTCHTSRAGSAPVCVCHVLSLHHLDPSVCTCLSGVFDFGVSAPRHHSHRGRIHIRVSIQSVCFVCLFVFVSVCNCASVSHRHPVRNFVQRNQAIYWAS